LTFQKISKGNRPDLLGGEMQKRAQMYYRNPCAACEETKTFLENHGVLVKVRDLTRDPLKKNELNVLLGYHDPRHYIDVMSPSFQKRKLDEEMPSREELITMIVENPDLLRHPIVLSGRLMTIGFNRQQMIEMFQLTVSNNGGGNDDDNGQPNGRGRS
jgi:arsenate reductase-like glutaredoxin family protein